MRNQTAFILSKFKNLKIKEENFDLFEIKIEMITSYISNIILSLVNILNGNENKEILLDIIKFRLILTKMRGIQNKMENEIERALEIKEVIL